MSEDRHDPKASPLQKVYDQLVDTASKTARFIRDNTEHAREQVQDLLQVTTEHVSEKTEEARKSLQARMAMLELEHHLNRLYPQIGKLLCDLTERQLPAPLLDKELRGKLDLATEYRDRLASLRRDLEAQQVAQPKAQ